MGDSRAARAFNISCANIPPTTAQTGDSSCGAVVDSVLAKYVSQQSLGNQRREVWLTQSTPAGWRGEPACSPPASSEAQSRSAPVQQRGAPRSAAVRHVSPGTPTRLKPNSEEASLRKAGRRRGAGRTEDGEDDRRVQFFRLLARQACPAVLKGAVERAVRRGEAHVFCSLLGCGTVTKGDSAAIMISRTVNCPGCDEGAYGEM